MQFSAPLIKGTLNKRYKRFLADVTLNNTGEEVTAHCPNTGAMTHCAEPGFTAWLSRSNNPKRKLAYTWELAQNTQGDWIGINTHNANKLVAEALNNKSIPSFSHITQWKAEVTPPSGEGRLDFQITELVNGEEQHGYIEVKSVTLAEGANGYFPDAVTQRGAKHCKMLAQLAESGIPCTLLFCAQHTGIKTIDVARHIDAKYADALQEAKAKGVKIVGVGCDIDQQKIVIKQEIPVLV